MNSLIDLTTLSKKNCDEIIKRSRFFESHGIPSDIARGKVIGTLFLSPSTRTIFVYQSAIQKMGGGWVGSSDVSKLSFSKGESLEDTVISMGNMVDVLLLRHPENIDLVNFSKKIKIPIINCGCGKENNVASALSTLLSIDYFRKGKIKNRNLRPCWYKQSNSVVYSYYWVLRCRYSH